jgi:hypothetical protein
MSARTLPFGFLAHRWKPVRAALVLAVLLSVGLHFIFERIDLNLRDEGYLWYGVQRVQAGEVPLRDFQSYDPGRYYWCAAFAGLVGPGIIGVRFAAALVQIPGLFAGVLALSRQSRRWTYLATSAVILLLWTFPRFKAFEHTIELVAVWIGVRYLEAPSARRVIAAGAFTGLAAFFGRNHGLYLILAFSALLLLEGWKRPGPGRFRRFLAFAGGVGLGYVPAFAMAIFVPGYAAAFVHVVRLDLAHGVNVPEPYPWFWRSVYRGLAPLELAEQLALDAAFLLPLVVFPVGIVVALRTRAEELAARALPIAATVVGLVYVHHYAVRSDLPHFAQASPPLLILGLCLPALLPWRRSVWVATPFLLALSLLVARRTPPFSAYMTRPDEERVAFPVAGEVLSLPAPFARQLLLLERAVDHHVAASEELFIVPASPTLYALLGKRSPTWGIHFLWPATTAEQAAIVRRLAEPRVDWILLCLQDYDHDPSYRFETTHPDVFRYIEENFTDVERPVPPNAYRLLRRR